MEGRTGTPEAPRPAAPPHVPDRGGSRPGTGVGPRAGEGFLARPLGAGRVSHLGRWSCQLPGKCGWSGRGRDWEAVEEGAPSGGVVVGTQGGSEVLRGVMAEVGAQSKLQLKKNYVFIFETCVAPKYHQRRCHSPLPTIRLRLRV